MGVAKYPVTVNQDDRDEHSLELESTQSAKVFTSEICYGALQGGMAKHIPKLPVKSFDELFTIRETPFVFSQIRETDYGYALNLKSDVDFAILDTKTTSQLSCLKDIPGVRFEAVVESSVFGKRQRSKTQPRKPFPLSINIFGPLSSADDAGARLGNVSANLQHPQDLDPMVRYRNPQFLMLGDEAWDMQELVGTSNKTSESLRRMVSKEIGSILESLTYVDGASDLSENRGPSPQLVSTLKRHQEDGLRFIRQRESDHSSRILSKRLEQCTLTVTCPDGYKKPPNVSFGGIIADTMGLGKTLMMLAAVTSTLSEAEESCYFHEAHEVDPEKVHTKATLVIVSSAQLLENWETEIKSHFVGGALKFVLFHGQDRPRQTVDLKPFDLVLTTYATLAADCKGPGLLQTMQWYRVVLDEAHLIRNSSSKQFKATTSLCSKRRWCLTGTPIQNRLQDLTSLAEFLKLPPFSKKGSFHREVVGRLAEGGPDFATPLRTWLEAYCLRRSREYLQLPPSTTEEVRLSFSEDEQRLYDQVIHDTRKEIDSLVSKGGTMRCNTLFTAMLKMRRLCNLGTFSRDSARSLQQMETGAGCERCAVSGEDFQLLLDDFSSCPSCGRPLHLPSSSPRPGGSPTTVNTPDSVQIGDFLTPHGSRAPRSPSPFGGFSTKLTTVAQNVVSSGPETKHIIFSCWTTSLDLLSQLLTQNNISHVQIDGRVSYGDRSTRLNAFKTDPKVCVLLMTTETGALGLNLTVATRIHLVEPQWNPSVEEQAIGRAVRMGQTREVTVVRYMMKKTVEQNIIDRQERKKGLAKFTFDTKMGESISETFEDLKSLLDLDIK